MKEQDKSKLAVTIILLRPAETNGFEVFLTRRPDAMALLGGMYCFPGGALREDDCSAALLRLCYGLLPVDARKIVGAQFSPPQALGLWIAGIRELFEEAGILLAVSDSGQPWAAEQDRKNNLADKQAALLKKTLSFRSLLETEGLLCDASRLAYFSHWQTAEEISIRFDTHFFLAALPKGRTPLPTSPEVAHSLWLTPDRALKLFAKEKLPMIFPTFASLRTLADFESLESVFKEYGSKLPATSRKASRGR
jgi:8-oxo-dGTP pyrophosphatase MutT (NUDIX family)